ncbi:MAG TPA: nicotinate-nucleotide adenylyltransferase [Candidatus Dormibacteraeota bacterium]
MRLGILGGTFDPIHLGHLAAARAAIECAHLDRVVFIPSAEPPHRAMAVAPAKDRLAMTRSAVEGEPRFEVSDIEISRGGVSYTSDTLSELRQARPDDELFLILGWDAASLFSSWHEPHRVSELASIVIVARPGTENPGPAELAAAGLETARVINCLVGTPDVSASEVRDLLAAHESVAGKVPAAVARYITSNHLYGDNRSVGT